MCIKSLSASVKSIVWKAHESAVVLCTDWSASAIVSGGEDCKYRVWDTFGRILYTSTVHEHPITSCAWQANGQMFAIGSFNLLRLCDRAGVRAVRVVCMRVCSGRAVSTK
jgi:intraflagellar transport protein 80